MKKKLGMMKKMTNFKNIDIKGDCTIHLENSKKIIMIRCIGDNIVIDEIINHKNIVEDPEEKPKAAKKKSGFSGFFKNSKNNKEEITEIIQPETTTYIEI